MAAQPKKRLGELLIEAGVIDEFQLRSALADQKRWGERLGTTLIKLGFVTEELMAKALSSQLRIPSVNLRTTQVPPEVYELIPAEKAEKYNLMPVMVRKEGPKKALYVAMSDPTNLAAIDELQFQIGMQIKPVIAMDSQIQAAIRHYYHDRGESIDYGGQPAHEPFEVMRPRQAETKAPIEVPSTPPPPPRGPEPSGQAKPSREVLALLRILTRKGLITKEEFLDEMKNLGD